MEPVQHIHSVQIQFNSQNLAQLTKSQNVYATRSIFTNPIMTTLSASTANNGVQFVYISGAITNGVSALGNPVPSNVFAFSKEIQLMFLRRPPKQLLV